MNYLKIIKETTVDGVGVRTAIYLSGCENRCPGCHNPESWDYNAGTKLDDETIDKLIIDIKENELVEGLSVLGGEPFAPGNIKELHLFLKKVYDAGITDIWVWTGYLYENLVKKFFAREAFCYITYLVDGPYIEKERTTKLPFRGSSNQRIIKLVKDSYKIDSIIE